MYARNDTFARETISPLGLSIEAAAEVSGFGRSKVFELIRTGALPARKVGRRTIILRCDLVGFMENLPRAGTAA
jgi:excisionase family DNA binding protein